MFKKYFYSNYFFGFLDVSDYFSLEQITVTGTSYVSSNTNGGASTIEAYAILLKANLKYFFDHREETITFSIFYEI